MFYCLCGNQLEGSGEPRYKEILDKNKYPIGEVRYKLAKCNECGLEVSTREEKFHYNNLADEYKDRGIADTEDYWKADDILPGKAYTSVPNGNWSKMNSRGIVIKKKP